ncbi:Glycosyl hydrolase family 43, five-bladed beta-propellor domain protein [Beauveria brongniartii RCEF 3172]|uniref:Glycosyl hydrolase family 43, five-bladed beta-propellor domain protein n=1 Tax=Beauveria brongniartii RCEF 3172 TaxID=1081107 RepID=A0A167BU18_9HYPO|nr:Glycosyl hydrolase family 43, five-bladed beta-propellor domain protein [Beauveria brongniartii RCEF 3172]
MLTTIAKALTNLIDPWATAHPLRHTMKALLTTARLALPRILALTSLASSAVASTPYRCATDEDCSLNGLCNLVSGGICACDAGWTGPDCGALDLRPAKRRSGYNRTGEGTSSWGARIVRDPSDSQLHHLFAAEFAHGCGLDYWAPYSRIVRAESREGAAGPYVFADEVAGTFAHNPTVVRSPADQAYLLYYIGCATEVGEASSRCAGRKFSCGPGNANNGESGISVKTSSDLRTWTDAGQVFPGSNSSTDWDADVTNPSAFPLYNARDDDDDDDKKTPAILLAYRGCPYDCLGREQINLAVAATGYRGPYHRVQADPVFLADNEDPFVWRDKRGHWHMLTHSLEAEGGFGNGPKVGRHAYARDYAGPWTLSTQQQRSLAFDTTVRWDDGGEVRFYRRERPQLMFSEDGEMTPLLLTTGVQPRGSAMSYTVIVPVGDAGVKAQ